MNKFYFFMTATGLVILGNAHASELDSANAEALQKTQELLQNQAAMNQYGKTDSRAQDALNQVRVLTGNDPKKMQEINQISSEIFTNMVNANKDEHGNVDTAKIGQQLNRAPSSFMQSLSPEQRAQIQRMAAEIDAKNRASQK